MSLDLKGEAVIHDTRQRPDVARVLGGCVKVVFVARLRPGKAGYGSAQIKGGIASHGNAQVINGALKVRIC
jgi:hypothetical protein